MVEPALRTLLVSAIGAVQLPDSGLMAASEAAIALAAIAARTEKKDRAAFAAQAKPLPEYHLAKNRHACPQAALDNGLGFVAG